MIREYCGWYIIRVNGNLNNIKSQAKRHQLLDECVKKTYRQICPVIYAGRETNPVNRLISATSEDGRISLMLVAIRLTPNKKPLPNSN